MRSARASAATTRNHHRWKHDESVTSNNKVTSKWLKRAARSILEP
jgi:hypothetical protein